MHIQDFNYNGQIIQRRNDGFISLTQMCAANGKRLDHWKELKATKAYIAALQANYPGSRVVYSEEGVNGGTWGHPSLAINLARWISADFAVWCDAHIFNLMVSGQTSLDINPIEEMKLKIELARLEAQRSDTDLKILQFRSTITRTCPEPLQQKILGYQVIEKVEYRDRVIANNQVINNGETLNKTELCRRYDILTKNGKPDYRRLNAILEHNGISELSDAWEMSAVIQENYQFKREYLPMLDNLMIEGDRQLYFGE